MDTTVNLIGLIPAAGKGLRLGLPYPKELYPIIRENRFKPITQFVVENLTASGITDIVFVINETKHQLMGYFGSGERFGCHITYVVQEDIGDLNGSTSPGLANALDSAHHQIRGKTVLFGMADTMMTPQDIFRSLLERANPEDDVMLGLFDVSSPEKFGMVQMDGDGRVTRIVDKPAKTTLRNAWGCIAWSPAFTEHLHECVTVKRIADFATILNKAISADLVVKGVVVPAGSYADLGTYSEIAALDSLYRQ